MGRFGRPAFDAEPEVPDWRQLRLSMAVSSTPDDPGSIHVSTTEDETGWAVTIQRVASAKIWAMDGTIYRFTPERVFGAAWRNDGTQQVLFRGIEVTDPGENTRWWCQAGMCLTDLSACAGGGLGRFTTAKSVYRSIASGISLSTGGTAADRFYTTCLLGGNPSASQGDLGYASTIAVDPATQQIFRASSSSGTVSTGALTGTLNLFVAFGINATVSAGEQATGKYRLYAALQNIAPGGAL